MPPWFQWGAVSERLPVFLLVSSVPALGVLQAAPVEVQGEKWMVGELQFDPPVDGEFSTGPFTLPGCGWSLRG